jgi:uncharacterized protein (TIGR00255 family)
MTFDLPSAMSVVLPFAAGCRLRGRLVTLPARFVVSLNLPQTHRQVRPKVTEGLMAGGAVTRSMTGFAAASGRHEDWSWTMEVRAVNGRGFDLKLRAPDWIDGLEPALRTALQARIGRGSVTFNLRLAQEGGADAASLNPEALDRALDLIRRVDEVAERTGVALARANAADVLSIRGVMENGAREETDTGPLRAAILADLPALLDAFDAMRVAEGAHLADLLAAHVAQVEALVAEARTLEPERAAKVRAALDESLARILDAAGADPARVAQELALLAVKSDVTEELDRLTAHVAAARALLAEDGPKGRKLDFLTQEFNREANTLCSKSQFAPLTKVGLDLKHVIDQMREQVQNVE